MFLLESLIYSINIWNISLFKKKDFDTSHHKEMINIREVRCLSLLEYYIMHIRIKHHMELHKYLVFKVPAKI